MRSVYLTIVFFLLLGKSLAQDECEVVLTRATEEFNAGHFYIVPGLLNDCLSKNRNREWQQRAYLLLAETYLLLEDPIGATQSYLNVLRANPEYTTDANRDPIDLVYLSRKFTASPVFSYFVKAGLNTSPVHVIHDVKAGGEADPDSKGNYQLRFGWQFGLGMDYNYNDRVAFGLELNYMATSYRTTEGSLFNSAEYSVQYTDRQNWLNIPIYAKYSRDKGTLRPYAYGGYAIGYLASDRGSVVLEGTSIFDDESALTNFSDARTRISRALVLGGGVKYKYKLNYFFVDLRYMAGHSNFTKERYQNEFIYDWPHVDDNLRLDNISLSFGYLHPLYRPRELKRARTKSVLRKIRKKDDDQ